MQLGPYEVKIIIVYLLKNEKELTCFFQEIPYVRHYKHRLVYFYPIFQGHFFIYKGRFFTKYTGAQTVHENYIKVSYLS